MKIESSSAVSRRTFNRRVLGIAAGAVAASRAATRTSAADKPAAENKYIDIHVGREFLIRRADRLLFGTDYLAEGQQVDQFAFLEQLQLPAEVQAKIFRDNARRVLGLG